MSGDACRLSRCEAQLRSCLPVTELLRFALASLVPRDAAASSVLLRRVDRRHWSYHGANIPREQAGPADCMLPCPLLLARWWYLAAVDAAEVSFRTVVWNSDTQVGVLCSFQAHSCREVIGAARQEGSLAAHQVWVRIAQKVEM